MSKEITSFFKEAPYLKFTMPIPKSDKFVMGLPQSLVMYINSQTKKCAAQRSVMFVLLTTMDYDKAVSILFDDFRSGKIGKITIETPADISTQGDN